MKLFLIFLFSFLSVYGIAQQTYPQGQPSPSSKGWAKYGYLTVDSGFIQTPRDTAWKPRYDGTTVMWLTAPGGASVYTWYSGFWHKGIPGTGSNSSGNVAVFPTVAAMQTYSSDSISSSSLAYVTDSVRGGWFHFVQNLAISTPFDYGTTFPYNLGNCGDCIDGWLREFNASDGINAAWYGIKTGTDGTYAHLNDSIFNYLSHNIPTGSKITVPKGWYQISDTIGIRVSHTLWQGMPGTVIEQIEDTTTAISIHSPFVSVDGFTIYQTGTGNESNWPKTYGAGITVYRIDNASITNNVIYNCGTITAPNIKDTVNGIA